MSDGVIKDSATGSVYHDNDYVFTFENATIPPCNISITTFSGPTGLMRKFWDPTAMNPSIQVFGYDPGGIVVVAP